jgi:hypothetical protein
MPAPSLPKTSISRMPTVAARSIHPVEKMLALVAKSRAQCCRSRIFIPDPDFYPFFLSTKLSLSSQKYGFGIRDPEKTYSGSRIQRSKSHRIPDPDPQHCSGPTLWPFTRQPLKNGMGMSCPRSASYARILEPPEVVEDPPRADLHGEVARDARRRRLVLVGSKDSPRRREIYCELTHTVGDDDFAKSAKRVRPSCGRGPPYITIPCLC